MATNASEARQLMSELRTFCRIRSIALAAVPNHHRKLVQSLQYQAPTFCAWLSPAGTARDAYEIDRCRWCQKLERAIVKPDVIVALGATAARSVLGRITTIKALRGQ